MTQGKTVAVLLLAVLLAACGQAPVKPAATHLRADPQKADGAIPPTVQIAPVLPKPRAALAPETYSVVVNNVRAQELLFALARDARLQIDIDPGLTGVVTLNAIDQTLPQLLARIARQVDMRWEVDGQTLLVMRDSPYLRSYRIDYLGAGLFWAPRSRRSTWICIASWDWLLSIAKRDWRRDSPVTSAAECSERINTLCPFLGRWRRASRTSVPKPTVNSPF